MCNKFSNRLNVQRDVIDIVNKNILLREPLISLSSDAINRWVLKNNINDSIDIICILKDISYDLSFMANRSQAPVEDTDKINCLDIKQKIKNLKLAIYRIDAI